jgi:hypothetical protein
MRCQATKSVHDLATVVLVCDYDAAEYHEMHLDKFQRALWREWEEAISAEAAGAVPPRRLQLSAA